MNHISRCNYFHDKSLVCANKNDPKPLCSQDLGDLLIFQPNIAKSSCWKWYEHIHSGEPWITTQYQRRATAISGTPSPSPKRIVHFTFLSQGMHSSNDCLKLCSVVLLKGCNNVCIQSCLSLTIVPIDTGLRQRIFEVIPNVSSWAIGLVQ